MSQTLSVSQALALVKLSLESISATIVGEVSELSDKPGYKAIYFTISDASSALPCLIWRNIYQGSGVELRLGMLVEVSGLFSLYAAKGRMNFDVKALRPAGEGDLRLKVAALAKKLEAEGLMDSSRKRPLPAFPSKVAVVTSPHGKAIHDVIKTLRRRFPLAELCIAGVTVEGAGAVSSIMRGLEVAEQSGAELILLVRGGGSYEDLMPFNDELLARRIAASAIPVVTGIGHEPDTGIADMVADFRASTPTAAAEHVVPDIREIKGRLGRLSASLANSMRYRLDNYRRSYEYLANRPVFVDPLQLVSSSAMIVEGATQRLQQALPNSLIRNRQLIDTQDTRLTQLGARLLNRFEAGIGLYAAKLEALSPLAVLARGYSITFDEDNRVIDSVNRVDSDQQLSIRVVDGSIRCRVTSTYLDTLHNETCD